MVTPFPNSQGPAKTCAPGPAPGGGSVPRSPGGRFSAACEKAAVVRKPDGPPSALLCAERRGLTARHAPEPRSHPRGRAFACVGEGREAPSGSPAGHPRPSRHAALGHPRPNPGPDASVPGGGGRWSVTRLLPRLFPPSSVYRAVPDVGALGAHGAPLHLTQRLGRARGRTCAGGLSPRHARL